MQALKQPLLHFMLAGVFLFWLFNQVNRPAVEDSANQENLIRVDEAALQIFVQHQTANAAAVDLSQLSQARLQTLVDDYVREEVLYREALAMGLDRDDYSIRLRLAEKMQFMLDNAAAASLDVNEEGLQQFYEERQQDYHVDAVYEFTHIFFDSRSRTEEKAEEAAAAFLQSQVLSEVTTDNAESYGDTFPFLQNYGGRTRDFVVNNFSEAFVAELDDIDPSSRWVGPVASPLGFHLVQLRARQQAYLPSLDAIRSRVEDDYVYEMIRRASADTLDALVSEYEVDVRHVEGATAP